MNRNAIAFELKRFLLFVFDFMCKKCELFVSFSMRNGQDIIRFS